MVYAHIVALTDEEGRARVDEVLAEADALWADAKRPVGTEERPVGAPAWWDGDETVDAVASMQAVARYSGAATAPG